MQPLYIFSPVIGNSDGERAAAAGDAVAGVDGVAGGVFGGENDEAVVMTNLDNHFDDSPELFENVQHVVLRDAVVYVTDEHARRRYSTGFDHFLCN